MVELKLEKNDRDTWDNSIVKIGYITEKTPWDQSRLVDTRTPMKGHQLTLISKTGKEWNINYNNINPFTTIWIYSQNIEMGFLIVPCL